MLKNVTFPALLSYTKTQVETKRKKLDPGGIKTRNSLLFRSRSTPHSLLPIFIWKAYENGVRRVKEMGRAGTGGGSCHQRGFKHTIRNVSTSLLAGVHGNAGLRSSAVHVPPHPAPPDGGRVLLLLLQWLAR